MSEDARDILRELLAEALNGTNGQAAAPQVPPPPVAAVHRPSTWEAPAGGVERVTLAGDDDLNRFVRDLLTRGDREAILAGRVRFTLGATEGGSARGSEGGRAGVPQGVPSGGNPSGGGPMRIPRGAVTERAVAAAAKAGGRLVLGPRAVLTPLAREKARALGLQIEREQQ